MQFTEIEHDLRSQLDLLDEMHHRVLHLEGLFEKKGITDFIDKVSTTVRKVKTYKKTPEGFLKKLQDRAFKDYKLPGKLLETSQKDKTLEIIFKNSAGEAFITINVVFKNEKELDVMIQGTLRKKTENITFNKAFEVVEYAMKACYYYNEIIELEATSSKSENSDDEETKSDGQENESDS